MNVDSGEIMSTELVKDDSPEETKEETTHQKIKILLLEMITNIVTLPPDQGRTNVYSCYHLGQNILHLGVEFIEYC